MKQIFRKDDASLPDRVRAAMGVRKDAWTLTVKAFDPKAAMTIAGCANKAKEDRWGDVIDPTAWDNEWFARFKANPIMLYQHDHREPIGYVTKLEIRNDGLYFEAVIGDPTKAPLTETQEKVRSLIAQGILVAFSVGFLPHVMEWDEDSEILRYTEVELLELSVVAVPMQQDSLITAIKAFKEKRVEPKTPVSKDGDNDYSLKLDKVKDCVDDMHKVVKDCHGMLSDMKDKNKALADENTALKAQLEAATKKLADTVASADEFIALMRAQGHLSTP